MSVSFPEPAFQAYPRGNTPWEHVVRQGGSNFLRAWAALQPGAAPSAASRIAQAAEAAAAEALTDAATLDLVQLAGHRVLAYHPSGSTTAHPLRTWRRFVASRGWPILGFTVDARARRRMASYLGIPFHLVETARTLPEIPSGACLVFLDRNVPDQWDPFAAILERAGNAAPSVIFLATDHEAALSLSLLRDPAGHRLRCPAPTVCTFDLRDTDRVLHLKAQHLENRDLDTRPGPATGSAPDTA